MAHPYHHSLSSVKKWGGAVDDYLAIHSWFDAQADHRGFPAPRAAPSCRRHLHVRDLFGPTITLVVRPRPSDALVGEQHVVEDLGFIPPFADWVRIRPDHGWAARNRST